MPRSSDNDCKLEFDVGRTKRKNNEMIFKRVSNPVSVNKYSTKPTTGGLVFEKMSLPSWKLHFPKMDEGELIVEREDNQNISISLVASREYFRYLNFFALTFTFGTVALYSYSIPSNSVADRGSITFVLLLTIITYYFQVMDELPKVPHETPLDSYIKVGGSRAPL
jgi:hypothetical protein